MRKLLLSLLFFPAFSYAGGVTVKLLPGHDINQARVELNAAGWKITSMLHSDSTLMVYKPGAITTVNGVQLSLNDLDASPSPDNLTAFDSALNTQLSLSHVDYYSFNVQIPRDQVAGNIADIESKSYVFQGSSQWLTSNHITHENPTTVEQKSSLFADYQQRYNPEAWHATEMAIDAMQTALRNDPFTNPIKWHTFSSALEAANKTEDGINSTSWKVIFDDVRTAYPPGYWSTVSIPQAWSNISVGDRPSEQELVTKMAGDLARDLNAPIFKSAGNPQFMSDGSINPFFTSAQAQKFTDPDIEIVGEIYNPVGCENCFPNAGNDVPGAVCAPVGAKVPNGQYCDVAQVCPVDRAGNPTIGFVIDTSDVDLAYYSTITRPRKVHGTSISAERSAVYADDLKRRAASNGYQMSDTDVYSVMEEAAKSASGRTTKDKCVGWGAYNKDMGRAIVDSKFPFGTHREISAPVDFEWEPVPNPDYNKIVHARIEACKIGGGIASHTYTGYQSCVNPEWAAINNIYPPVPNPHYPYKKVKIYFVTVVYNATGTIHNSYWSAHPDGSYPKIYDVGGTNNP